MKRLRIGITCGDPNGIGLEVILKTLESIEIRLKADFYLFCSSQVLDYHKKTLTCNELPYSKINPGEKITKGEIGLCDPWNRYIKVDFGEQNKEGGQAAFDALSAACLSLEEHKIDALITAPLSKANIGQSKWGDFTGHTGYLAGRFKSVALMIMAAEKTRVAMATDHVSLNRVSGIIDISFLKKKIDDFNTALKFDFGVQSPSIAILGLNPHAGDDGKLGQEEENIIQPCIEFCKTNGINVSGPFPSDSFFGKKQYLEFDGVLAMYHDQGLIPFKMLYFKNGVNNSCGLPFVRTSPDHGVAFDIAGKNEADEASFRESIFQTIERAKNRLQSSSTKIIPNP
ncbi:MAG: 4-hydroxythreonine-4-phosphate dehydrogenase [Owenweeksia sp. TMED14]|nr:MAG: 4-hydroxythreonine-4-phosphate dehydrogenase [Owenweeksia sp. TMED14]